MEIISTKKPSEKFQEIIDGAVLEIGQVVQYRLLDPKLNPDPEDRRKREFIWRQGDYIRCHDRIKDPFSNDLLEIIVPFETEVNGKMDTVPAIMKLNPYDTNGFIVIVGGNPEQEQFYQFMEFCNENEDNPYRSVNVKPKFKKVDAEKEAKKKASHNDLLTILLGLVKDMSLSEKKEVASAFGWDRESGDATITARLQEIILKDPEGFDKRYANKNDISVLAIINDSLAANIITFSPMENKWTFTKTGEVIATLTRNESIDPKDQFLEWIKTNNKGNVVLKNLKYSLKPALVKEV